MDYRGIPIDIGNPEFNRYKREYVQSFIENASIGQTIEEWTYSEGQRLFPVSEIYRPTLLSVALCGSEYNRFSVNSNTPDWYTELHNSVKESLIDIGLASESDKISLTDVTGNCISNMSYHELQQLGAVYPTVNGKRSIDTQTSNGYIGCAVDTPATHAVNKEQMLQTHMVEIVEAAAELCLEKLVKAKTMNDLENYISNEDHSENLLPVIKSVILESPGHLGSFAKIIEHHSEPAVLKAVQSGELTHDAIATDISRLVLDELALAMVAHNEDVDAFYQAKQLSPLEFQDSGKRTIYGKSTLATTNTIDSIFSKYPTAVKLHSAIVEKAFGDNAFLGCHMCRCLKEGGRHKKGARRRRKHRHDKQVVQCETDGAGNMMCRRHVIHDHSPFYGKDRKKWLKHHRRLHQMRNLPPAPRVEVIPETEGEKGAIVLAKEPVALAGPLMRGDNGFPKHVPPSSRKDEGLFYKKDEKKKKRDEKKKKIPEVAAEMPSMEAYQRVKVKNDDSEMPDLFNTYTQKVESAVKISGINRNISKTEIDKIYPGTMKIESEISSSPPPPAVERYQARKPEEKQQQRQKELSLPHYSSNIASSLMMDYLDAPVAASSQRQQKSPQKIATQINEEAPSLESIVIKKSSSPANRKPVAISSAMGVPKADVIQLRKTPTPDRNYPVVTNLKKPAAAVVRKTSYSSSSMMSELPDLSDF